jgi:uncharacterized membrane protein YfhO
VVRTNGLVLGVPVPPGRHVVRVGFTPPGVIDGLVISVVSLIALFAVAPASRRWRSLRGAATRRRRLGVS